MPSKPVLYVFAWGLLLLPREVCSQEFRLWTDGFLYKTFGSSFENELNLGYDKLLQEKGWGDVYLCNNLTWEPTRWYAAEGGLELHYTNDPEGPEIAELRALLGQKITFTENIRIIRLQKPYFYIRYEQRFLGYPESDSVVAKSRIRLRAGGRFMLNNIIFEKNTFYIPFLFEYYFNFNGEAFEKYAGRSRGSIGLGYIISPWCRTELMYHSMRSRNTVEDDFVRSDNIIQVLVRYYLK